MEIPKYQAIDIILGMNTGAQSAPVRGFYISSGDDIGRIYLSDGFAYSIAEAMHKIKLVKKMSKYPPIIFKAWIHNMDYGLCWTPR